MTTRTDELGMVMIEDETPDPVIVPEGEDPMPRLRAMQKFIAGTGRGECEILDYDGNVIGRTVLIGAPEKTAQPVFDVKTRVIEVATLRDWMTRRGFTVSRETVRWDQVGGPFFAQPFNSARRWRLVMIRPELPPLPPTTGLLGEPLFPKGR